MDTFNTLFVLTYAANTAVIVVLVWALIRFWRELPWLGVLVAYFALSQIRGTQHIFQMMSTDGSPPPMILSNLDLAINIAGLAVMGILALSTGKLVRGLRESHSAAKHREREYERAHRHYTQLIRHRIVNPVTVIRGAAITLQPRDGVNLDEATTAMLLDAVLEASDAIEAATFVPQTVTSSEAELNPVPDLVGKTLNSSGREYKKGVPPEEKHPLSNLIATS